MPGSERIGRGQGSEVLAAELASGATVAQAAAKAGMSEATAYRRLRDPEFVAEVRELRGLAVRSAAGRLAVAMSKAVGVLEALLTSETETTRLRAADRLLDHAVKTAEVLELEQRVEELECMVAIQRDERR